MKYKRIVFKVGTSSLTHSDGKLAHDKLKHLTAQLAQLHEMGYEIILVSSGAIAAGFSALGFKKRPTKIAHKQASAAVGQGLLMEEYTQNLLLKNIVSAQILLTQSDFADNRRYKNAHQALSVLLEKGAIPIINENDSVAIEELKVGDNDTLSAQVAAMVQADLLVLLTDIDGLYTDNPRHNPQAKRINYVSQITTDLIKMAGGAGSTNGTGGMLTKLKAATLATKAGVNVYICASSSPQSLIEAVQSQTAGTFFQSAPQTMKTHKQWLAFYAPSKGEIWIDEGATHALRHQGTSLLLSGITKISGYFQYHDIVTVFSETTGEALGKGKVLLGQPALVDLMKAKSPKGVVIHRDDWIAITPEIVLLFSQF